MGVSSRLLDDRYSPGGIMRTKSVGVKGISGGKSLIFLKRPLVNSSILINGVIYNKLVSYRRGVSYNVSFLRPN